VIELDRYLKHNYEQVKSVNPQAPAHRQKEAEFEDVEIDEGVDI
jgi:hypothetical protein